MKNEFKTMYINMPYGRDSISCRFVAEHIKRLYRMMLVDYKLSLEDVLAYFNDKILDENVFTFLDSDGINFYDKENDLVWCIGWDDYD